MRAVKSLVVLAAALAVVVTACGSSSRQGPRAEEAEATQAEPAPAGQDAAPAQSFTEGMQAFCSAPDRVRTEIEAEPQRKATILAREVRRAVTNPEAKDAIGRIGGLEPAA